jgi:hypothetical protein
MKEQFDIKKLKPIVVAQIYYLLFSQISFEDDLADYLRNGVVISRPDCFGMARLCDVRPVDAEDNPIGEEPEYAWFVRFAAGNLLKLISFIPGYLPKIVFCRNKLGKPLNTKLRIWPLGRMIKLATALQSKKEITL